MSIKGPFDEVVIFNKIHKDFVRLLEKIDERRYCSGGDDGLIVVWDVEEMKDIHTLQAHSRPIACLHSIHDASSSKALLLSSSSDHQIIVWDVDDGVAVKVFSEKERMARCLTTLQHGNFLSGGEHLLMWSLKEGMVDACNIKHSEDIRLMQVLQSRYVLVVIDNHIMVTQVEERGSGMVFSDAPHLKLKPHREAITSLEKIGESCFISGSLDGSIAQWAVDGWVLLHHYNSIENYLTDVGNRRLYSYSVQCVLVLDEFIVAAHGDSLHCYNACSKRLLVAKKSAHRSKINHLCALYNGHLIATCSGDAVVNVWRIHQKCHNALEASDQGSIAHNLSKPDVTITLVQSCSLHSTSVLMCLPVAENSFLSSDADHQVLLWRDGFAESLKRDQKIRDTIMI